MRAMLIVNPHATSTTGPRRDLLAHALGSQVTLSVQLTSGRGHAMELAAKAVEGGAQLVVVHGGDGTVNEAINGIMSRAQGSEGPMLAVVPGGSTNVFARALGIEADPTAATEQILAALAQGRAPRVVSLGLADDRYFAFNAGLGLDAEVVKAVADLRATGRRISNTMHVRKTISAYLASDRKKPRLTVELPGREPVVGAHLLFVSNLDPWTYWEHRPVRTNPGTAAGTGLGAFALTSLGLPTVVRVAWQLFRDRPPTDGGPSAGPRTARVLRDDDAAIVRATSDEPIGFQMDGDYLGGKTIVTFRSMPAALRVLGPVAPVGTGATG